MASVLDIKPFQQCNFISNVAPNIICYLCIILVCFKAYDTGKLADSCHMPPSATSGSFLKAAPLATPDPIDVFGDYAQVKVSKATVWYLHSCLFGYSVVSKIPSNAGIDEYS